MAAPLLLRAARVGLARIRSGGEQAFVNLAVALDDPVALLAGKALQLVNIGFDGGGKVREIERQQFGVGTTYPEIACFENRELQQWS
jgi:hypothetical protein